MAPKIERLYFSWYRKSCVPKWAKKIGGRAPKRFRCESLRFTFVDERASKIQTIITMENATAIGAFSHTIQVEFTK